MNEEALKNEIHQTVGLHGAICIDITIRGTRTKRIVEVFADSEAGVSADDLATISRALHSVLDAAFQAASDYLLIVSSPGLDQPLRHPWQYRRHKGRLARMHVLSDPPRDIVGTIEEADDETVTIQTATLLEQVAFTDIRETIIQPSLK